VADYVGSGEYEKNITKDNIEAIESKKYIDKVDILQSEYEYDKEINVKFASEYSNNHILTIGKGANKDNNINDVRCDKCNEIKLNHICKFELQERDKERKINVDNLTSLILQSSLDIVKKNKALYRQSTLSKDNNTEVNILFIQILFIFFINIFFSISNRLIQWKHNCKHYLTNQTIVNIHIQLDLLQILNKLIVLIVNHVKQEEFVYYHKVY
jgi:hypothetical protein